jgi:hypothetical protein
MTKKIAATRTNSAPWVSLDCLCHLAWISWKCLFSSSFPKQYSMLTDILLLLIELKQACCRGCHALLY